MLSGTAFGRVDERFAPERLADRLGYLMRASTPGADLVYLSQVKKEMGVGTDVFISHASEDSKAVAKPLEKCLNKLGLTTFVNALPVGKPIRKSIDSGVVGSRAFVVVLSPSFFGKPWPEYELDGIVDLAVHGKCLLVPIWHDVTHDDVSRYSPSLANWLGRSTAITTVDAIAEEIAVLLNERHKL